MDIFGEAIILTFFACLWIGLLCWVLGLIQRKFQQRNNEYQQRKNRKT